VAHLHREARNFAELGPGMGKVKIRLGMNIGSVVTVVARRRRMACFYGLFGDAANMALHSVSHSLWQIMSRWVKRS